MTNCQNPINISNCEPYLTQLNQNLNIMNQLNLLQMVSSHPPLNIQLNNNLVINSTLQDPKNTQQQSNYILLFNLILFIFKERYRRKKNENNGKEFTCDCGKLFMSKIALNSHIKLKHPEKIEGKIKKGRGRPKKYPLYPELDIESTKFDNFFNLPKRKVEEGKTLNILQIVENVFNDLYLGPYADKLFSKPKSFEDNYILNNLVKNGKLPEKARNRKNCDEVFYEYLSIFKNKTNEKFFTLILKFILLFRECYDVSKNIAEEKKEQVTNKQTPEVLPDLCNEFYDEFLENNNFFGIADQDDRKEIVDIIQHFFTWLFKNDYTRSKLSISSSC